MFGQSVCHYMFGSATGIYYMELENWSSFHFQYHQLFSPSAQSAWFPTHFQHAFPMQTLKKYAALCKYRIAFDSRNDNVLIVTDYEWLQTLLQFTTWTFAHILSTEGENCFCKSESSYQKGWLHPHSYDH